MHRIGAAALGTNRHTVVAPAADDAVWMNHDEDPPTMMEPYIASPAPARRPRTAATTLPQDNQWLAALPPRWWEHCLPQLERIALRRGDVLHEAGLAPGPLYFPTTAGVSLLQPMENGASAEVAVIGADGVVGLQALLDDHAATGRSVVHADGEAFRLEADALRPALREDESVLAMLLRQVQTLLTQAAQTAACNRHHSLRQQLCRRLLVALDHVRTDEIRMTHELIASLLGVRREGVTEAALRLQQAGAIQYRRGRIRVLDRAALEAQSCECYAVMRRLHEEPAPPEH